MYSRVHEVAFGLLGDASGKLSGNQDVNMKNALRSLAQNPGFSLTVVLTLAVGIAANVLIFSVLYAVLIRPLPYVEPERLYSLFRSTNESGQLESIPYWSFPKYQIVQQQSQAFDIAAFFQQPFPLTGTNNTERLQVEFATPNYFSVLGIQAATGRTFLQSDSAEPMVLLGHNLWQRRFRGSEDVVGKTLQLDGKTLTVVGVLPESFHGQSGTAEVWVPMNMLPAFTFPRRLETAYAYWHEVIARLKPGVTEATAQADLKMQSSRIDSAFPQDPGTAPDEVISIPVQKANLDPRLQDSLVLLCCAVGLVLLIACVNVANMILARSISRKKEIGIRIALGAGRRRIIQLLLAEAGVLALTSGVLAIVLAVWGADLLSSLLPQTQSTLGLQPFRVFSGVKPLDFPVIGFAILLSAATAFMVGLPVALRLSNGDINNSLKNGSSDASRLPAQKYARLLVSSEVALSLILLVSAGLLIHSFWKLQSTNLGVRSDHVLTLKIDYPRDYNSSRFQGTLLQRLSAYPGVTSASVASTMPLSGMYGKTGIRIEGRPDSNGNPPVVGFHIVSSGYFSTLQIPFLRGQNFSDKHRDASPRVAIVTNKAAKELWPNENPIGQRLRLGLGWEPPNDFAEVIGVVGDVKYGKVDAVPTPDVYLHYLQPTGELCPFVIVKSDADPTALTRDFRAEIRRIDSNLPVYDIKTMEERIGDANSGIRFIALVLAVFAGLALSLAGIGIFAVTSYTVSGRRKEIAIRMALGSTQRSAMNHIIRDIGMYVIAGTFAGLVFAFVTTHLFKSLLFQVVPNDPATILISAAFLLVVAYIACYLPARRATRIDPMKILKYE